MDQVFACALDLSSVILLRGAPAMSRCELNVLRQINIFHICLSSRQDWGELPTFLPLLKSVRVVCDQCAAAAAVTVRKALLEGSAEEELPVLALKEVPFAGEAELDAPSCAKPRFSASRKLPVVRVGPATTPQSVGKGLPNL